MKLIQAKELLVYEGFVAYLATMLQAIHRTKDATLTFRRTDGEQLPVADGYADVVVELEASMEDEASGLERSATVELTSSDAAELYAIRLRLYRHVFDTEPPSTHNVSEEKLWEGVLYAPSEKNNATEVGEVIATAVAEFLRDEQRLPESVEFIQGCIDQCQE